MKRLGSSLLLLVLAAPLALFAQSAYLVKDINTTTTATPSSSTPANFIQFGSRILFTTSSYSGYELWSTDGTTNGTTRIANTFHGQVASNLTGLVVLGDKVLFNARNFNDGEELFVTDGTPEGTKLLADIRPGSGSSLPGARIVYHGKLYFAANDGLDGGELWSTDGTPAGTHFVKDLVPGSGSSDPTSFVIFHDLLYFDAGGALWKSDGTDAGTVQVKAVYGYGLQVAGDRMFFSGYTTATGTEPWVSDGTEAGTHLILDIAPGDKQSLYYGMTPFGDRVLFVANEPVHGTELWISDGTAAGTHVVRDIAPGAVESVGQTFITVMGNVAYFAAGAGVTRGQGLWKTDGTEAGTTIVRDVPANTAGSAPGEGVALGGKLYFTATSAAGNRTLWVTDGTDAGTHQVKTSASSLTTAGNGLNAIDGRLYFAGANALNGFELWTSDGTDAGTSMVMNVYKDAAPSSAPLIVAAAGDWVYFLAWDGSGTVNSSGTPSQRFLWRSDGTSAGTVAVADQAQPPYWPLGHSLIFGRSAAYPWISDGTPEGTKNASLFLHRFPSTPYSMVTFGDKVFANVNSDLWLTTTAPDAPAYSLGSLGTSNNVFTEMAGRVMFLTSKGLWSSDGTVAGSYAIVPDLGESPRSNLALMGGALYFGTDSRKLWKSDGTFEGTVAFTTLQQTVTSLVAAGNHLFFPNGNNNALWVTDGTDAGTRALPATLSGVPVPVGDRVVFLSNDATYGPEPWVSDGTPEGTHVLLDIAPGISSSAPSELLAANGLVYFTASDNVYGKEIFVTDGTAAGTKVVADVEPGPASSAPSNFVRAGERIFFSATTAGTGTELWALPLPATPRLSIDDVRVTEGNSGTTTARFTVTLSAPATKSVTVDYATSDGTATAGSDYDAASGSLTFAPGETSKSISVAVRGDAVSEGNETFFVTLRNAANATLEKAQGFAMIEDDDQSADVGLTFDYTVVDGGNVTLIGSNSGPRAATNLKFATTATPGNSYSSGTFCQLFCNTQQQLASGATMRASVAGTYYEQHFYTATLSGRQSDPQPSNNTVAWTSSGSLAMDALYLTPGSDAHLWFYTYGGGDTYNLTSSNPSVVSVPATITIPSGQRAVTFLGHGAGVGTATIKVTRSTGTYATLDVNVFAAGTKPRWPGAITAMAENVTTGIDRTIPVRIYNYGQVPYSGERATGVVIVKSNGQELGRTTLPPDRSDRIVPVYASVLGTQPITIEYGGDANFLPMTVNSNLYAIRGSATLTATADRSGATVRLHVSVTGSPMVPPTGKLAVSLGSTTLPDVVLTPAGGGVSKGEVVVPNVAIGMQTFSVAYGGDTFYYPLTQSVRIPDPHRRIAGHE